MGTPRAAPFGATTGCPLGLEWLPELAPNLAVTDLARRDASDPSVSILAGGIPYGVSTPAPTRAVIISDPTGTGPQFRLVYELKGAVAHGRGASGRSRGLPGPGLAVPRTLTGLREPCYKWPRSLPPAPGGRHDDSR